MFTGIVEELGTITAIESLADGARLTVSGPVVTADAKPGDSLSVNGVCLTVVEISDGRFTADVVGETLQRSTLGGLREGDRVNLERAMALGDRLGGHIVQGHVDGTATVLSVDSDGLTRFELPERLSRYLVEKGSITVDGVSLTVVDAAATEFGVAVIPTTAELTTLGLRHPGDPVNLEVDALAKYLEKLAEPQLTSLARGHTPQREDNGGATGRQ
ncbi:riboflavin synthase alpha chain [Halopolyspora algeriensis]|uniref:Riboflavin synthase n=1 Tax=Halopolyspora algeriensis TaxID=1500506 RepID=A0A368VGR7_9ACTN|nr:riboflavin synthase [Halopolyspora algeriensis]RCW40367.1 riboflavin synthase alpha chain [Halopolyspora algeriensis]TQM53651.1 riboflavin synthase alpha chain [Halopolyspora algeriensis]